MEDGYAYKSAIDGLLRGLDGDRIAVLQTEVKGHGDYTDVFYVIHSVNEKGEWTNRTVPACRRSVLARLAGRIYGNKILSHCVMADKQVPRKKGRANPYNMGNGNIFVQIQGQNNYYDLYNLKYINKAFLEHRDAILNMAGRKFKTCCGLDTVKARISFAIELYRKLEEHPCQYMKELESKLGLVVPASTGRSGTVSANDEVSPSIHSKDDEILPKASDMVAPDMGDVPPASADPPAIKKESSYSFVSRAPMVRETSAGSDEDEVLTFISEQERKEGTWMYGDRNYEKTCQKKRSYMAKKNELERMSTEFYDEMMGIFSKES